MTQIQRSPWINSVKVEFNANVKMCKVIAVGCEGIGEVPGTFMTSRPTLGCSHWWISVDTFYDGTSQFYDVTSRCDIFKNERKFFRSK